MQLGPRNALRLGSGVDRDIERLHQRAIALAPLLLRALLTVQDVLVRQSKQRGDFPGNLVGPRLLGAEPIDFARGEPEQRQRGQSADNREDNQSSEELAQRHGKDYRTMEALPGFTRLSGPS